MTSLATASIEDTFVFTSAEGSCHAKCLSIGTGAGLKMFIDFNVDFTELTFPDVMFRRHCTSPG